MSAVPGAAAADGDIAHRDGPPTDGPKPPEVTMPTELPRASLIAVPFAGRRPALGPQADASAGRAVARVREDAGGAGKVGRLAAAF